MTQNKNYRWLIWVLLIVVLLALMVVFLKSRQSTSHYSKEATAISRASEVGASVREKVYGLTARALKTTTELSKLPELAQALKDDNSKRLEELANLYVANSDSLDIISFFTASGEIRAVNTKDSQGRAIDPDKISRVMSANFKEKPIITSCLTNLADKAFIEFQRHCDFTPAFFGSSGLSVALSVPVMGPEGQKVGVISTRLNFERVLVSLRQNDYSANGRNIYLVSKDGYFFSEEINSGVKPAPMTSETMRAALVPLTNKVSDQLFIRLGKHYLNILPLGLNILGDVGEMYLVVEV